MKREFFLLRMFFLFIFEGMTFSFEQSVAADQEREKRLIVTMLDVAHGDLLVLEFPSGQTVVVDAARIGRPTDMLFPYLKKRGIVKIDALSLSHNHIDHIAGAAEIIENIPIGEIWNNGEDSSSKYYKKYMSAAQKAKVPVLSPKVGDVMTYGESEIRFLSSGTHLENENDNSLIFRLSYRKFTMLFTGDGEIDASQGLMEKWGDYIPAVVLKAPHHGHHRFNPEFLKMVNPRYTIVSAPNWSLFGLPDKRFVEQLEAQGSDVKITYKNKTIQFTTNGDDIIFTEGERPRAVSSSPGNGP